jgi:hypothetical protein
MNKQQVRGADVERSGGGVISDIIPEFSWKY